MASWLPFSPSLIHSMTSIRRVVPSLSCLWLVIPSWLAQRLSAALSAGQRYDASRSRSVAF
jgi:hypothetical protein